MDLSKRTPEQLQLEKKFSDKLQEAKAAHDKSRDNYQRNLTESGHLLCGPVGSGPQ